MLFCIVVNFWHWHLFVWRFCAPPSTMKRLITQLTAGLKCELQRLTQFIPPNIFSLPLVQLLCECTTTLRLNRFEIRMLAELVKCGFGMVYLNKLPNVVVPLNISREWDWTKSIFWCQLWRRPCKWIAFWMKFEMFEWNRYTGICHCRRA